MVEPDLVARAEVFVEDAYRRADKPASYVEHSMQVGELLSELGCGDEVVAAGVLHDVMEDTFAGRDDVRDRFGERVGALVEALTESPAIEDYRERKRALRDSVRRAGFSALVIFAADKLARMRAADWRDATIERHKLEHYQRALEMLMASGIRTPHVKELDQRLRRRRTPSQ